MRFGLDRHSLDLGLGGDAVLVRAGDVRRSDLDDASVVHCTDVTSARRLLWGASGWPSSSLREIVRSATGRCVDDDDAIDALAEMIASGSWVILRIHRIVGDTASRADTRDRRTEAPLLSELLPARPATTWIEIRCVGRRAESDGGARVKLRMPDGEVRQLALDDASCVRIDGIETSGTCWIELAKDAKRRGKSQRNAPLVRDAAATIVGGGAAIGVSTARAHVVVVKEKRYAHSW